MKCNIPKYHNPRPIYIHCKQCKKPIRKINFIDLLMAANETGRDFLNNELCEVCNESK